MFGIPPLYIIIFLASTLASSFVGRMLQRRFRQHSQVPINLSGREIAELMLQQNGLHDVQVTAVKGQLTDHYNPMNKTVNLSEAVYNQRNVAAAAVAAHECGHALQHAKAYAPLTFRSKMVPLVNVSNQIMPWILGIGLFTGVTMNNPTVLLIGIAAMAATTLFAFVTLPVEFDASNRALAWLETTGLSSSAQHGQAKNALWWAAMTYVVGALAALGQLLYFVMIFLNSRD